MEDRDENLDIQEPDNIAAGAGSDMRKEALDDIGGEVDNEGEDSAEEGANKAANFSEERDDLNLDRNDDYGEDGGEGAENKLLPVSEWAFRGKEADGLTLNRQPRSLAMAAASRTPSTRVHKSLSNGTDARASTSTMTPSTATLRFATMGAITSRVALLPLIQPAQWLALTGDKYESHSHQARR